MSDGTIASSDPGFDDFDVATAEMREVTQQARPRRKPAHPTPPPWRRTRVVAVALGVVVILALLAVLIWQWNDDGDEVSTGTSTTTATTERPEASTAPTTAQPAPTAPPTTPAPTATAPAPPGRPPGVPPTEAVTQAVYPFASSAVRFDDPVAAATAFARDWVGFTNPVIGPFMQGDLRSGEVEVRPRANGPVTTVMVRQFGPDDTWWVLGSATGNVNPTQPAPGATISSPVSVRGTALAFEGHVAVEVRQDNSVDPIGEGFVTGGGDVPRPFQGQIAYSAPTTGTGYGAMLFLTRSAEDGRVWEAATYRVRFS